MDLSGTQSLRGKAIRHRVVDLFSAFERQEVTTGDLGF